MVLHTPSSSFVMLPGNETVLPIQLPFNVFPNISMSSEGHGLHRSSLELHLHLHLYL